MLNRNATSLAPNMENELNPLPFLLVNTVKDLKTCELPVKPLCELDVQESPHLRRFLPIPTISTLAHAPSPYGWISEASS